MWLDTLLFRSHLEDDEHISVIVHKHWLIGLKFLFWPVLSFWLSLSLLVIVPSRFAFILVSLWSSASLVWLLRNFFDYYLDAWIVTDHGIIDLEWHGWFHRQTTRVLYSDVNGVSCEIVGIFGTLLRYGTLTIEKISTGVAVSLECVPRPKRIEMLLMKNMENYLHSKNLKDSKRVQEILAEYVAREVQRNSLPQKSEHLIEEESKL